MSPRPLALITALTGGDFALWNWSLGANHTVLALLSGLTLPPLAAACALMLMLAAVRLATRVRPPALSARARRGRSRRPRVATAAPRLHRAQPEPAAQTIVASRTRGGHAAPGSSAPSPDAAPATAAQARRAGRARKLAA